MYDAVTGSPMPSTSEASAISASAISRLPPAQSANNSDKVLPTPVVPTAITTIPTAISSIAVLTMLRVPSASASRIARGPMRFGVNQLDTITARIA